MASTLAFFGVKSLGPPSTFQDVVRVSESADEKEGSLILERTLKMSNGFDFVSTKLHSCDKTKSLYSGTYVLITHACNLFLEQITLLEFAFF